MGAVWVSGDGWGWADGDRLHESGCNQRMEPAWSGDMGRGWKVRGRGLVSESHDKPKVLVCCDTRGMVGFGRTVHGRIKQV